MSFFSMSMMAIGSRLDETLPLLQGADRSEIQSDKPWELLSYHRRTWELRWRGSLRYSNIGANYYYYHWYW